MHENSKWCAILCSSSEQLNLSKALERCQSVAVANSSPVIGTRLKGFKLMGKHVSPNFTSSHS